MPRWAGLKDLAVGITALYLSVWLYEASNWISLTAAGGKAIFLWSGILPAGVASVTTGGSDFAIAKLLQVGICVALALPTFMTVRRRGLPFASVTLASIVGLYITSVYWEMLSLASLMPVGLHELSYVALSIGATAVLMRAPWGGGNRPGSRSPHLTTAT